MNNGNDAVRRKALLAGAIGNIVEWYDFTLYGYFATTIATVFFPKSDPTAALLSTFAIFAVAFLIRPVGAVAFGHLGDRFGRRIALLLSVMLMSSGTVALGLLPGYARIGTMAPVLLVVCRLVQGFSAAGEYTGAAIFVTEHAPVGKRGRYASLGAASASLGGMFGIVVSVAMTSATTAEQLTSWGWRVPFIAAAPLALIGLYLRLRIEDSPVFAALRTEGHVASAPVKQALEVAKKPILIFIGWSMANAVAYYLLTTFLVSYLITTAKLSKTESLTVQLMAVFVSMVGCVLAGFVIDTVGLKRVAVTSALCVGVWAVPAFALLEHSTLLQAALVIAIFAVLYCPFATITNLAVVDLFPAQVRASASALAYSLAYTLFGGTAPYVATWLVGRGYFLAPGYYLAGLCVVAALVAALGIGNHERNAIQELNKIPQQAVE